MIFISRIFTQISAVWVCDLETRPNYPKSYVFGPYIALYLQRFFLVPLVTSLNKNLVIVTSKKQKQKQDHEPGGLADCSSTC
jgi:hypothetical protein